MDSLDPEFEREVDSLTSEDLEFSDDEEGKSTKSPAKKSRKRTQAQAFIEHFERLTGSRPDSTIDPETGIIIPDFLIGTERGIWRTDAVRVRLDTPSLRDALNCYKRADSNIVQVR